MQRVEVRMVHALVYARSRLKYAIFRGRGAQAEPPRRFIQSGQGEVESME